MKISIIGCGWLGLPLAQKLIGMRHTVFGSTTQNDKLNILQDSGIIPFIFDGVNYSEILYDACDVDLLILNFPPRKSSNYAEQVKNILKQTNIHTKVIFTSSTGVYEDVEGNVTEESPIKADHPVALAEKVICESGKAFSILRLAGLIGGERHPIKHLSGKNLSDGNMSVNLIHRDDVIAGISKLITTNCWYSHYNLVYPEHPSKAQYYTEVARKMNLPEPIFDLSVKKGKCVSGKKIAVELGFVYDHPI